MLIAKLFVYLVYQNYVLTLDSGLLDYKLSLVQDPLHFII